jgi:hypothetical protein
MRLGEFLAVMAADKARAVLRLRQHRYLHEVDVIHRGIEQAQRGRVDHVLRILQHEEPIVAT